MPSRRDQLSSYLGYTDLAMPALQCWGAVLFFSVCSWAATSVGTFRPGGHATMNGSPASKNAEVPAGAVIETTEAGSRLAVGKSVKIQLMERSRVRVWEDHLVLESGGIEVSGLYLVEAAGLKVYTLEGARATVGLRDRLNIATAAGLLRVQNAQGLVLSFVEAGKSANFAVESSKASVESRTGCLVFKDSHFLLQDDTTRELVELRGPDLELNLGNRVVVSGTRADSPGLNVTSVSPRSQGGCLSTAAAIGASTKVPDKPKRP